MTETERITQGRIPLPINDYIHFALLQETFGLQFKSDLVYINGVSKEAEISKIYHAGMYGFTNKKERDKFINLCNRSSQHDDICQAISLGDL